MRNGMLLLTALGAFLLATFAIPAPAEERVVVGTIVRLDAGSIIEVDYYFSTALEPPDYHQRFATIVGH